MKLKEALAEVEILKGDIDRKLIYAHPKFAEPMLDYIIEDFENSRFTLNNSTIGAMVVCASSEQARELYRLI